jgi:hypothetical protein
MTYSNVWSRSALCSVVLALAVLVACGGMGGGVTNPGGGGGGGGQTVAVSVTSNSTFVDVFTAQQFFATVTGDPANKGVTWSVDTVAGGNATVGTISATGLYTPPSTAGTHTILATSVADTTKSASASLAVVAFGVYTYHNDLARDGANPHESALTVAKVSSTTTFGKKFSMPVDGVVYAQPLWVPGLSIAGGNHNALFVATQHDSIYAFDADSGTQLWKASLLDTNHGGAAGETTVGTFDVGFGDQDIQPEVGVTGTPVIDPATKTLYVVSKSENPSATFHQRLHALDLLTGNEKFGGPANISASVAGVGDGSAGGSLAFDPQNEHQRSALALVNGVVYIAWAAHEDKGPYHGWLIGYNAANLQQHGVFNSTPNGGLGGIWMSGGGPAADASGNLYMSTGNGTFDGDAGNTHDYGDSALKITPSASSLSLNDWFTPFNQGTLDAADTDLAAAGVVLLPGQTSPAHLLAVGGKEGRIYLLNRDSMGHFCGVCISSSGDTNARQTLNAAQGIWGTPAFWNNNLYVGGAFGALNQFTFNTSTEMFSSSSVSNTVLSVSFPGVNPAVSSNGASNGIVWAIDATAYGVPAPSLGPAVLHAYNAGNLGTELWNSTQAASSRDQAGDAVKFSVPTIVNGKVYIGTRSEVDVYGLLP